MFYNLSARDYIKSMISPQEKIRKNIRNLCCQQIEIIRCTPICLWVTLHPCNHHEDCSHGFWSGGGAQAGCSVAFAWKFYPLRSWPWSSSTPGRRDGCFQFQAHISIFVWNQLRVVTTAYVQLSSTVGLWEDQCPPLQVVSPRCYEVDQVASVPGARPLFTAWWPWLALLSPHPLPITSHPQTFLSLSLYSQWRFWSPKI